MGVKIPRPPYLDPHPVFLTHCAISYQDLLKKSKYLRNTYIAKLLWFYNCSIEDFKTSEAQVWVGVKIPRPPYLDPHPVFLTHCAISYQDLLKKSKYLRNTYIAKLLWFYNCSIEDFKTSEAQVWVGVKIPRPQYLDPPTLYY